ncbi:MAG: hypothetical protein IPM17_08400 [Verrucomicrobia bacterium]|nr:hypothetical protein [Verrucomicrobiota bacterium]
MSATPVQGRGKNSRFCPALDQFISPADCGAQRGSKIVCRPACAFFPFGTQGYDLWLKLDGAWLAKAVKFLADRLGREELQRRIRRFTVPMRASDIEFESAFANALNYSLFVEREADGRTRAEIWAATTATRDLNNDEQVMLRHRMSTRPGILEVQEVLDSLALRCIDLLDPERGEFVLFDRGAAAQMVRFSRMLTWVTHYPHFSRTNVFAMDMPHNIHAAWLEEVSKRAAAAGTNRPGYSLRDYLAENFVDAVTLVNALADEYRRRLFASLDVHHCVASYLITGDPAAVETVLRGKADFEADTAPDDSQFAPPKLFFRWLQQGESAECAQTIAAKGGARVDTNVGGVGTVGNVRLYPERLLIETFSRAKHDFARQKVAQYLGELVTFEKESIVDLAKILEERRAREATIGEAEAAVFNNEASSASMDESVQAQSETNKNKAEEPIPDPERQEAIQQAHRQHYERFLDESNPALDGQTPRAAATNPALRPKLVELMKAHLHGLERRCREDGLHLDIDWVLDALDLASLKAKPRSRP